MDKPVEPTLDEHGYDTHPAFGMIGASRVSSSPPGAVLFDSEIRHGHYVVLTVNRAVRKRDLKTDWTHSTTELIEVAMSEAQWASFVSSMNTAGVPCTLRRVNFEPQAELPFAPRLAVSMAETTAAADEAFREIREAFETYAEHKTAANLRMLQARIENAVPNVRFAGNQLSEHVETTVQKARADIEAIVARHAQQLGIEPSELSVPELEAGPST